MFIPRNQQTKATWSGGVTYTICFFPATTNAKTGGYLFWANIATIDHKASYSYLPGYQRLHLILNDPGLHLHFQHPDQTVRLGKFDEHHFDGARPVEAVPVNEQVLAFNIIMQQGITAATQLLTATEPSIPSGWVDSPKEATSIQYIFYGIRGQFMITLDEQIRLEAGDAYYIAPEIRTQFIARQAIFRPSSPDAIGLLCKIVIAD